MDPIDLYVYRAGGLIRHTGLLYKHRSVWYRADYGPTDSLKTRLVPASTAASSGDCVVLLGEDDDLQEYLDENIAEHQLAAAGLIFDELEWKAILNCFLPGDYHLLTKNCRNHCLYVLQQLSQEGTEISSLAMDLLKTTTTQDAVIGGVTLTGIAFAGAFLIDQLFSQKTEDEQKRK